MKALFADDAYLSTCEATVTGIRDDGGIELDQTCFYATSGGQPSDTGVFERADGTRIQIAGAINAVTTKVAVGVNEVPSGLARALKQHADSGES